MRTPRRIAARREVSLAVLTAIGCFSVQPAPAQSAAGEWTIPARDFANTRFSELTEITASNIRRLRPSFAFSSGVLRGHEGAPIVADGTMYVVTPYPNILYALDLTRPGAPLKWKFQPDPAPASQGVACCDVVNRGAAFAGGKVFFNTLDGQTVSVDARTGRELWRVRMANIEVGESMTMAPLLVKNKVMVGNSGGEFGVRGWISALDADSGRVLWKAYSTGPDSEVLIGPEFKPFYPQDRGQDLGERSWPGQAWRRGGGTVWGWISYDPQLNLIYYGTGNPGPWNAAQRAGDNRWTAGIFARDPDSGQARWFYQTSPHDLFDYDAVNECILLDLTIDGRPRKVLAHPDRNGYFYIIDRESGEVLSAKPFVAVNTVTSVDLKTGRPNYAGDKTPVTGSTIHGICPHAAGGKDWQPSAYSPLTRLVYIPHQNLCQDEEVRPANYIAGTPYIGANVRMFGGPGGYRGALTAWDPAAGRIVWEAHEDLPVWSGALVTAGGVVFYGTMDGWFKALDASTGKLLWQYKLGSGIIGQPTAYRGPDGKEYVAILAGVGGWAGGVVSGHFDLRDTSAGNGWAGAVGDLATRTNQGGTIYAFALP